MLVAVGVVAGTLSGLLGVGGGVVTIPALVLLLGVPAAVAKGSSLAVIIPTAVVGTRRNVARDNADLRTAAVRRAVGDGVVVPGVALSVEPRRAPVEPPVRRPAAGRGRTPAVGQPPTRTPSDGPDGDQSVAM